jgi:ATP-dependent protease ClpP protease subunit
VNKQSNKEERLIHQPSVGGLGGQASDVQIYAEDLIRTKRRLNEILADRTGQPYEKIERDTDRDYSARSAIGPGRTNEEFRR